VELIVDGALLVTTAAVLVTTAAVLVTTAAVLVTTAAAGGRGGSMLVSDGRIAAGSQREISR
jgi:hypothetical protein